MRNVSTLHGYLFDRLHLARKALLEITMNIRRFFPKEQVFDRTHQADIDLIGPYQFLFPGKSWQPQPVSSVRMSYGQKILTFWRTFHSPKIIPCAQNF